MMDVRPRDRRRQRSARVASLVVLRLLGLAIVVSLLLLAPAAAGPVDPERCAYGAISAIGPVDAHGNGDTTPEVACMTAP
jgi:hypothetical protein